MYAHVVNSSISSKSFTRINVLGVVLSVEYVQMSWTVSKKCYVNFSFFHLQFLHFFIKWTYVNTIIYKYITKPSTIYLLKSNNIDTRIRCEIHTMSTINTLERLQLPSFWWIHCQIWTHPTPRSALPHSKCYSTPIPFFCNRHF